MADLLSAADLEKAKKHDTFHSEVITGKSGGESGGADIDYATNAATGQVQKTLPKTVNDLDWSYVGKFADGVTFTKSTDFALDANSTQWIYAGGSFPFTATPGTTPSTPNYQVVHVGSHEQLADINAAGGHDEIYSRTFSSVAAMQAYSGHVEGLTYKVAAAEVASYKVVASVADVDLGGGLWADKLDVDSDKLTQAQADISANTGSIEKLNDLNISAFDQIKNRMLTNRVDFVGIGDSNQIFGGYGFDSGIQQTLLRSFPMYATGLISGYENLSVGSGTGYGYSFNGGQSAALFTSTGAPAGFDAYLDKGAGGLFPHYYAYLATGTVSATATTGMTTDNLSGTDAIGLQNEIVAEVHHATFSTGSGSFEAAVRLNGSPFTQLATTGLVNTNTGTDGIAVASMTVPADPARTVGLGFRMTAEGVGITAPFAYLWMRLSVPSVTNGFSYHTLDFRGGQSLRAMAYDLQQMSDTALGYFLEQARSKQGKTKMVVIYFNSGLNDRNETLESVGPNPSLPGDSVAAYVDNATALVQRIEQIWAAKNWDRRELYFLAAPSHPISNPDDTELVGYRQALKTYMQTVTNAQYVDFTDEITSDEMLANGWYNNSGADRSHLTQAGYGGMSDIIFNSIK